MGLHPPITASHIQLAPMPLLTAKSRITNVHANLPLREKIRRARDRRVWSDSVIVRVDLD